MAGRAAGGVVLAEPSSPAYVRWALEQARRPEPFEVAVFDRLHVAADRAEAYRATAPWLAGKLDEPNVAVRTLPFYDELAELYAGHGAEGLVTMPVEWWTEIGAIGTVEDAAEHIAMLEAAGVHHLGLSPLSDVDIALRQLDEVLRLANR